MIKKILNSMVDKFRRSESLRKILYTIGVIVIYKLLSHIPLPLLDVSLISQNTTETSNIFQMFLGGGTERFSILSLGIMPYLTATILTQLLTSNSTGADFFRALKNDQNTGITQLNKWTKYFTLIIALLHGTYNIWNLSIMKIYGINIVAGNSTMFFILGIPIVIAGALISIWLSNLISKNGISNGTNVIIFMNIISEASGSIVNTFRKLFEKQIPLQYFLILALFIITLSIIVIFVDRTYYKLRIYNLGSEYINKHDNLKIKLNNSGVMPIIIASYLSHIPQILEMLLRNNGVLSNNFTYFLSFISINTPIYFIVISLLIVFSTINHSEISVDPKDISRQLQEYNIVVMDEQNIRPGLDTEKYIRSIISYIPVVLFTLFVFIGSQIFSLLFNTALGEHFIDISGASILLAVNTATAIFNTAFVKDHASIITQNQCDDFKEVEKQIEESYTITND